MKVSKSKGAKGKPTQLAVAPELSDDERRERRVANVRSMEATSQERIVEMYEWLKMLAWEYSERGDKTGATDPFLKEDEFVRALGHMRALESEIGQLADCAATEEGK